MSLPTARKWVGRYLAEGEVGFLDRSSRSRCSPRAIAPCKALAIVELRRSAAVVSPRSCEGQRARHKNGGTTCASGRLLNRSASRGSTQEETVADYFVHHGLIAVLPIRLQRALSRYGILTRRERWLSETARRVGLHRSTAHHLMQMLVSAGYLRQEKTTRGYELKRLALFYAYENSVYASLA